MRSVQDFIIHRWKGQEMKEQTNIRRSVFPVPDRRRFCAFVHFATDNIHQKSLLEALRGPLFKAYPKRQPFDPNLYRAYPIIDVPQALRDIVAESGAYGTCDGAEDLFTPEVADSLDNLALRWKEGSDPLWQARHPSFQPEPIPEPVERVEALAEVTA